MANLDLLVLESTGAKKRRPSSAQIIDFSAIRVGASNLAIAESSGKFDMGGIVVSNIGTPSVATDAATKGYVDTAVAGATFTLLPQDQIIHVSKDGVDGTANGSVDKPFLTIKAALAAITDATSSKQYVVNVGPGTYTEADDFLLKPYVTIAGARFLTSIATVTPGITLVHTIASGSAAFALRDLTINNGMTFNQQSTGGSASVTLTHVNSFGTTTVNSNGTTAFSVSILGGLNNGVTMNAASQLNITDGCAMNGAIAINETSAESGANKKIAAMTFRNCNMGSTINIQGATATATTHHVNGTSFSSTAGTLLTINGAHTLKSDVIGMPAASKISLSNGAIVTLNTDASSLGFSPAVSGNWTVTPTQVKGALDELASRVKTAETGLTSEATARANEDLTLVKLDGSRAMTGDLDMGTHKIVGLVNPTTAQEAATKNYVDTQVSAVTSGLSWRAAAKAATGDADLIAAAEGATLSTLLPFADDDAPAMVIGDFAAGDFILSKNGASSKLWKVYDDSGTLKLTLIGFAAIAAGDAWLVMNDLPDSPASQEGPALYTFTGADLVKVGDMDWGVAEGIDLSGSYAPTGGVPTAGDSVQTAIAKLDDIVSGAVVGASGGLTITPSPYNTEVSIAASGVDETKIAASALGTGLMGGGGVQLEADYARILVNDNALTIDNNSIVYVKANGHVDLAQANNAALPDAELGIVDPNQDIASSGSGRVILRRGAIVDGFSSLTPGQMCYVSRSVAGGVAQSLSGFVAGEHVFAIGRALSATEIIFDPEYLFEY